MKNPESLPYGEISAEISAYLAQFEIGPQHAPTLAGSAGSGRLYYRIRSETASFILMHSSRADRDFGRFLRLTQFFRLLDFPVPQVFCIDDSAHQILLEDLGDTRLFDRVASEPGAALTWYQKAIDVLVFLQTECRRKYHESPDIASRVFGVKDLLWESAYYESECRAPVLGKSRDRASARRAENFYGELAAKVAAQSRSIMHRDFQSQNLMLKADALRVIDYQGSRMGSIYYDLASLLLDPYVMLEEKIIEALLVYYHTRAQVEEPFPVMRAHFHLAGLQRIMQALGAYGFLSRKKGLADFARHVEPGRRRLEWLVERCDWRDAEIVL